MDTHTLRHARTWMCSIHTSGWDWICVCACLYARALISACCGLIESSIVSNDPCAVLLFYLDQRAKSCCDDKKEVSALFVKAPRRGENAVKWRAVYLQRSSQNTPSFIWYLHFDVLWFDFYLFKCCFHHCFRSLQRLHRTYGCLMPISFLSSICAKQYCTSTLRPCRAWVKVMIIHSLQVVLNGPFLTFTE